MSWVCGHWGEENGKDGRAEGSHRDYRQPTGGDHNRTPGKPSLEGHLVMEGPQQQGTLLEAEAQQM